MRTSRWEQQKQRQKRHFREKFSHDKERATPHRQRSASAAGRRPARRWLLGMSTASGHRLSRGKMYLRTVQRRVCLHQKQCNRRTATAQHCNWTSSERGFEVKKPEAADLASIVLPSFPVPLPSNGLLPLNAPTQAGRCLLLRETALVSSVSTCGQNRSAQNGYY